MSYVVIAKSLYRQGWEGNTAQVVELKQHQSVVDFVKQYLCREYEEESFDDVDEEIVEWHTFDEENDTVDVDGVEYCISYYKIDKLEDLLSLKNESLL